MAPNFSDIQELLQQRADYQARLKLMPYEGTPEIKEQGDISICGIVLPGN